MSISQDHNKQGLSSSTDRGTFQSAGYIERLQDPNISDDEKEANQGMLDYYLDSNRRQREREQSVEWQTNNLEYDLRSTDWILDKVRNSETYAQNLYAAMCNNGFIRNDVWPILLEKEWSCSWRYAGGIIADMREKGDYINWYCSGIGDGLGNGDVDGDKSYVSEGCITEEIKQDLLKLGWIVAPGGDHELYT